MYILAQQLADPAPDPDSAPEKKVKGKHATPTSRQVAKYNSTII